MTPETMPCCEDFNDGSSRLNSAMFFAQNHGVVVEAKPFNYCPWCGTRFPNAPSPETSVSPASDNPEPSD